ncbi:hypothetical protein [Castellaniella sp. UC4442_H9]
MNDVSEAEAREILAAALSCEDCPDWRPPKGTKGIHETSCGLLDSDGVNVRLVVDLIFKRSSKTGIVQYKFSVFRRGSPARLERVFQLDVIHWPKGAPSEHHKSHEHFGDNRTLGDASWEEWTYDDVMGRFRTMTNITFKPPVPHPEELQLRGQS